MINGYGVQKRTENRKRETVKCRTYVGNRELVIVAKDAIICNQSHPDNVYCDIVVSSQDLGFGDEGCQRMLIRKGAFGRKSYRGPFDKDIIRFTSADGKEHVGTVCFEYPNEWYVESIDAGTFALNKIRDFKYLGTTLSGAIAEDFTENEDDFSLNEDGQEHSVEVVKELIAPKAIGKETLKEKYVIYTCGGAVSCHGPTGYGYVITCKGKEVREGSDGLGEVSNAAAELISIKEGLKDALSENPAAIEVYTRSEYAAKCINLWGDSWKRNNWKKKDGSAVKNAGIIRELLALVDNNNVKILNIVGAGQDAFSKRCGYLAERAAMKQLDEYGYN